MVKWPADRAGMALLPVAAALLLATLAACDGSASSSDAPAGSRAASPLSSGPVSSGSPAAGVCPADATPDEPGPAGQARPDLDAPAGVAMDAQSGRVVAVDAATGGTWDTWTFDVCANTWQRMTPLHEPDLGRWARLVYDADADLIVALPVDGHTAWTYSVEADDWQRMPATASSPDSFWTLSDVVYDARSGDIVARDPRTGALWSYAVEANRWSRLEQRGRAPSDRPAELEGDKAADEHVHSLLTYDAATDRLVLALIGAATWTFDRRAATWTRQESIPPAFNTGYVESGGEAAFDPASGLTVALSDALLSTYDASADEWRTRTPGPGWPPLEVVDDLPAGPIARLGHWLIADPVNGRVVMLGGRARTAHGIRDLDDVWAYDVIADRWVELVPARSP